MINPKLKQKIDEMDYESMFKLWRFSPAGEELFQGETGNYFIKVMMEKKGKLPEGEHCRISKKLWREHEEI